MSHKKEDPPCVGKSAQSGPERKHEVTIPHYAPWCQCGGLDLASELQHELDMQRDLAGADVTTDEKQLAVRMYLLLKAQEEHFRVGVGPRGNDADVRAFGQRSAALLAERVAILAQCERLNAEGTERARARKAA